jgi:hypothetical protein
LLLLGFCGDLWELFLVRLRWGEKIWWCLWMRCVVWCGCLYDVYLLHYKKCVD